MRLRLSIMISLAVVLLGLLVLWPPSNCSQSTAQKRVPAASFGRLSSTRTLSSVGSPRPYRLSNTTKTLRELVRSETAILLENALVDTAQPISLRVPENLRARGEPGTYIVQAKGPPDQAFRLALTEAGAAIVSYIPNNSYLVQASADAAARLKTDPRTEAVLPYEPYYKLKGVLLRYAVEGTPLPKGSALKLLLFPGAKDEVAADLQRLQVEIVAQERSPFGPVLQIVPSPDDLTTLTSLPGVQEIEAVRTRVLANDLSRVTTGVTTDSTVAANYLGLTGSNVLVNVNDTGVDSNHPDLSGRVVSAGTDGTDTNGHGTHVAGIIAGNGTQSSTVPSAKGSVMPPVPGQFRGKASAARLYSVNFQARDSYLQETAAQNGALISNNSWNYHDNEYDLAAASYDAAVRDALPEMPGQQPLLCVFPAGNDGALNRTDVTVDVPEPHSPDTILSPGTAKNVLTVGALEQRRQITNPVTTSVSGNNVTTKPWSASTDSSSEVAAFSARGNTGIGVEGEFGRFKPDLVAPGAFVLSTRSGGWSQTAYYDGALQLPGNAMQVLSNINEQVGPFYRYESGCSMAAAELSGTLALMEEFFARLHRTNSPALMKALLVNGARPSATSFGLAVAGGTNHQGWGTVNLTNALPWALTNGSATASPMLLFDQSPSTAVATAEERVFRIAVAPEARSLPLRVTLTWTDPAANPLAGVKLVNDLDLSVTNLSNGSYYFGNDIPEGGMFSHAAAANAFHDCINNVENVILQPPLGASYSIAVAGRGVNVNAVSARMEVVQDFALVVSSGNGEAPNALALVDKTTATASFAPVVAITNSFGPGVSDFGGFLTRQSAGASSPALAGNSVALPSVKGQLTVGSSAQWRFYTIINEFGYTNAAFFTFNARTLGAVQIGANAGTNGVAPARAGADVDLYVSTDSSLTNLNPLVIASAEKSLSRGGAELVVLSNALPVVYFIAIKSEGAQAAEFSIAGIFGEAPFSEKDADGGLHVRGIPAAVPIPDGAPYEQPSAIVFAVADQAAAIHRVIVTNTVTHSSPSDLTGVLSHDDISVVLNDHPTVSPGTWTGTFDDSGQLDTLGAVPAAGPGSLRDFVGHSSYGVWVLTQTDSVPGGTGTNDSFGLFIEPEQDLATGLNAVLLPSACREDLIVLPAQVTNLLLNVSMAAGTGPVVVGLCPVADDNECLSTNLGGMTIASSFSLHAMSDPPLHSGKYVLRLCNSGDDTATINALVALTLDTEAPPLTHFRELGPVPIVDDGLTSSILTVTNVGRITGLNVGVGIEHPRVSDLDISLVSPAGTRVLLAQNRGGVSEEGLGLFVIMTNDTPVSYSGGAAPSVTNIDTGQISGTVWISYLFYLKPDDLHVYYEGNRIFDSGMVSGSGVWFIPYGPGSSTTLTIVVNEAGNFDPDTQWDYTFTWTKPDFLCAEFTENTNLTVTPIKFAIPPFTNAVPTGPPPATNGIYYLPEESLDKFNGEIGSGDWRLEIRDSQAGATNPTPALIGWQLCFLTDPGVPLPLPLTHAVPRTETVRPGHLRFFVVDVPIWATFATNSLLASSAPLDLLFNAVALPFGTNGLGDYTLLTNALVGTSALAPGQAPPALQPGTPYFLAVQNTSSAAVTFTLRTDFAMSTLQSWGARNVALAPGQSWCYAFDISPNALRASVVLTNLTANGDLVLRKGLPLPMLTSFDVGSFNPETNAENIFLDPSSSPVPLSEGRWYAAVYNVDSTNLFGTILFNEFAPPAGTIVITGFRVENDSLCLTWSSLAGQVYQVQGRADLLPPSQWAPLSPVVPASGTRTSACIPFSAGYNYFRIGEVPPP